MKLQLDRKFFDIGEAGGGSNIDILDALGDDKNVKDVDLGKDDNDTDDKNASDDDDSEIKITDDDDEDEDDDTDDKDEKESKSEDDDEGDEEDEELSDIVSPFSKKNFEKKFPGALKEFPQIERAINTVTKFREIFPTVNDALEAQTNLERYGDIEKDLASGSSKGFLGALREKDGKAFSHVIDNYLDNLKEVDEGAYYHVVGNNVKSMIIAMATHAEEIKNDDLLTAARILNEFTFGTSKFVPKAKFAKEENKEENELKGEREQFAQERLETHQSELSDRIESQVSKKITEFIDSKNEMAPYVKNTAIREANELVAKAIDNDKDFRRVLDRLWEKAAKDKYSQESLGNIKRAYISKANTYLPQIIKKVRQKALGTRSGNKAEADRQGPLARGKVSTPTSKFKQSGGGKAPTKIPEGMSAREFLLQDD